MVHRQGWDENAPTYPEVTPSCPEEVLEENLTSSCIPANSRGGDIIESHVHLLLSRDAPIN